MRDDGDVTASPYIGRLAPSPTGLLHLGHARTFLIAGDRARAAGGALLLRMDDLDGQRSKPEFIEAAREDLAWLGLRWTSEFLQSERLPLYREALDRLLALGLAYPCRCSRRELQSTLAAPHDEEPVYPGTCRPQRFDPQPFAEGANYRFRVPDQEEVRFIDGGCGTQRLRAGRDAGADFGDFLVWRRDGLPSYQLASIVDDAAMRITEVVRGADLLTSTARQILLQRALGFAEPAWFHAELLRDEAGVRLAKRYDALSLRALRAQGVTPEKLRERLGLQMRSSSASQLE